MDDVISRQAAIDALEKEINKGKPPFDDVIGSIRCGVRLARNIIENLPFAQPEGCELCDGHALECGDTLYQMSDWDGGIGFDYIRDIHYCPVCGKRLNKYDK